MTTGPSQADIAKLLNQGTQKRRGRRWAWAAIALIAVIVTAQTVMRSDGEATAPAYRTEPVTRGTLAITVSTTGTLQPTNTVDVGSELSGLVEAVFVDENDAVKRGQVLARLDTSKLRDTITRSEASLASAQARLAQSNATVKESNATLERLREVSRLSGGKVPSQAELETAEANVARAEGEQASSAATVREVQAALNSDRTNLSKASISSPINGVVLKRSVEPGQTVAASLQVATLFTIAEDLRQMELEVDVDEADVGRVKDGQHASFTVDAYADRTFRALVTRVAYGSTTTGDVVSYTAVLKVDNDDLVLRPGMTASAEIASASIPQALLVPNAALRFTPAASVPARGGFSLLPRPPGSAPRQTEATSVDGNAQQVWVLSDGVPKAVPVSVGLSDGRFTEVKSGELTEGAQVITDIAAGPS